MAKLPNIRFACHKKGTELVIDDLPLYTKYVKALRDDRTYELSIHEARRPKTHPQLAWYYAVVIPMAIDGLREAGHNTITVVLNGKVFHLPLTPDNVDIYVLKPYCARVRDGQYVDKRDMTDLEMGLYLEHCAMFLADYLGVTLPEPDKNWRLNNAGN